MVAAEGAWPLGAGHGRRASANREVPQKDRIGHYKSALLHVSAPFALLSMGACRRAACPSRRAVWAALPLGPCGRHARAGPRGRGLPRATCGTEPRRSGNIAAGSACSASTRWKLGRGRAQHVWPASAYPGRVRRSAPAGHPTADASVSRAAAAGVAWRWARRIWWRATPCVFCPAMSLP